MTSPEFSFPVNELDAGGKRFQLPVRAAWLRGALEGTQVEVAKSDGQLDLRLSKSGTDVVIRGTLTADLVVPCSRCLDPTLVAVHEEVSALAVPKGAVAVTRPHSKDKEKKDKKAKGEDDDVDAELSSEEADVLVYEGENLVLDELVRDELLLGIPMIPLCSESCPGISRGDSARQDEAASIDPRLRPLLKLKNNEP